MGRVQPPPPPPPPPPPGPKPTIKCTVAVAKDQVGRKGMFIIQQVRWLSLSLAEPRLLPLLI